MRKPSKKTVKLAKLEIQEEDKQRVLEQNSPERQAQIKEIQRKASLPSEHPEHICGMMCDGQDGYNSYCSRLRRKLGY